MTQAAVSDLEAGKFDEAVLAASAAAPVVVDFWAPWCGPCRTLGPTLERLAAEADGAWRLVKVNVDENPELAQRYGVQGIPAVKAFVDGAEVDAFVGAQPEPKVRSWLGGFVKDPVKEALRSAKALAEAGDLDGAEAAVRAVLAERPDAAQATLSLASILAQRGEVDAARAALADLGTPSDPALRRVVDALTLRLDGAALDLDALAARVKAAPDDLDARWSLSRAHAARGAWDDTLAQLLAIVRSNRKYRDDGARKEMLRLFDILGAQSPITAKWRGALSRLLF